MTGENEFELDKLRAELAKERHMKLVVVVPSSIYLDDDQQS